jgi:hypothetical protein
VIEKLERLSVDKSKKRTGLFAIERQNDWTTYVEGLANLSRWFNLRIRLTFMMPTSRGLALRCFRRRLSLADEGGSKRVGRE